MGICWNRDLTPEQELINAEKKNSRGIEQLLVKDKRENKRILKLLLLGPGQSGKSTLFKQMNILYIGGFADSDREFFTASVHNNVVKSIKALCQASDRFSKTSNEYKIAAGLEETKNKMLAEDFTEDSVVTEELGQKILDLWADPGIQQTFENRCKFQLNDSTAYFFNRLSEIALSGYIPTEQDILRTRVPTTGIVETEFVIERSLFKMFDVGGQRSERKKMDPLF